MGEWGQLSWLFHNSLLVEIQVFDYNIRGCLLGMNRSYVYNNSFLNQSAIIDAGTTSGETFSGPNGSPNWFGFELSYDKLPSVGGAGGGLQYNGNITCMFWKGANDMRLRKYDYGYDAVNRLMRADFTH